MLEGIDLKVPAGTVFALLGPNGAGKTTMVQILSTLIRADGGRAAVFGHDVASEPDAVRTAIGVTGQFSAVDDLLTGEENLRLMADLHHLERVLARQRHCHARGLLPDPARDASGYRRYGCQAVIDLIRIKTLADAGVPLSRVRELLQADPEQFARAVDTIDDELQGRIRTLQSHREAARRLAPGDGLGLPDDVVAYLTRLRALGLSERTVGMERDGWILLCAQAPDQ